MTSNPIISIPHKNLRKTSKKVLKIDQKIKKIIKDMISATITWDNSRDHEVGVALAAVQIDQLYRIIIVREDYEDKKNNNFVAYINPSILKLDGNLVEDFEGCLSVPDIYGKVPRYSKAKIKALDQNGQEITFQVKDFLARIFQHEIDHTNGILFIDHIKDKFDRFYILNEEGKLKKLRKEDVEKNNILW